MDIECVDLFTKILAISYSEGIIGKNMFAVDGCKLSSNCSKEWSGTKTELLKKADKINNWLAEHDDKIGAEGKPIKSTITDNESAKMSRCSLSGLQET